MPRMRTAAGILTYIKKMDPDTAVTLWYLRRLISSGAVPVLTIGRKKLVDLDAVLAALASGGEIQKQQPITGQIRRIDL